MNQLNYHHLRYFYMIAKYGSVAKASELLHITPQTISGQLAKFEDAIGAPLFDRQGKRLIINQKGKVVFDYAEDIFSKGDELTEVLTQRRAGQLTGFTVGITDVIPKILAFDLIRPAMAHIDTTQLVFRAGNFESLITDFSINKIDLVLADRPLPPGTNVKAYSHFLGESGISFFATPDQAEPLKENFPASLENQPLLLSGDKTTSKRNLLSWLDKHDLHPKLVAEFDDSAILKLFGQDGFGIFCAPSSVETHVANQYRVACIGRTAEITERYFAISAERTIQRELVKSIFESAQQTITK